MSARLAIVNPVSLLGQELREGLERQPELWSEVRLQTTDPEAVGTVTEIAGAAALVEAYDADVLRRVDLVFHCGWSNDLEGLLDDKSPATTLVVVAPGQALSQGVPVVAGVNLDHADPGSVLISPHPSVVAVAHLVFPLTAYGLQEVVAHVVQPASMKGQEGLDELFEQTRSIVSFAQQIPKKVFGAQQAFNLLPVDESTDPLVSQLHSVLGMDNPLAVRIIQGGIFHGLSASVFVRLAQDPGTDGLHEAIDDYPQIERVPEPDLLGPVDAAAREEVLVGSIEPAVGSPGAYWIWGVMDNLTRGGATNAIELAKAVLTSGG
jgi:aspartate-semialdehyde dehydrogenase